MLNMAVFNATTKQELVDALQDYPEILFAILYGSAVEEVNPNDLDVGIFVDRVSILPEAELDYAFVLADELERKVPYPVDVRVINDAPLGFRYNVSRGQALLVNNRAAFYHFLERTWDEWFDFQPVAMQYLRELR
jgi:predicted nucleotidyltransferase